ncbi:MAG: hypothetical protein D6715_01535 [Calditrichaeota bacterium]|nr:MAG: hypothetical protein D6715_01535 [Calditrichota bacterium]
MCSILGRFAYETPGSEDNVKQSIQLSISTTGFVHLVHKTGFVLGKFFRGKIGCLLAFWLAFVICPLRALPAQDSLAYYDRAVELIELGRYASAHRLLQEGLQQTGFEPRLVTLMVENALKHFSVRRGVQVFFLQDSINEKTRRGGQEGSSFTAVVYYPNRLLLRVLQQKPDFPIAHKLLGDFYRLQMPKDGAADLVDTDRLMRLKEKILSHYLKAAQLGLNEVEVNRWLGDYYLGLNQKDQARQFYRRNVEPEARDAASALKLADLALASNQFSEAFNHAMTALELLPQRNTVARYRARRLAALALLNLGESESFVQEAQACIQLIPGLQQAYLDLLDYYFSQENEDQIQRLLREMLLNNPYERAGFQALEKYAVNSGNFDSATQLLDEIVLKFEFSDQVMGQVYWTKGNLLYHQGQLAEARKLWEISRSYFSKMLPEDSSLLKQVGILGQNSPPEN